MSTPQEIPRDVSNQCSSREKGRGRGRGRSRGRGLGKDAQLGNNVSLVTSMLKERYSPNNSPSSSRRVAQTLYQPGAFSKLKNVNGSSSSEKDSTAVQLSCEVNSIANEKRKIQNPKLQKSFVTTKLPNTKNAMAHHKDNSSRHIMVDNEENCGTHGDPAGYHVDPVGAHVDHDSAQVDIVSTQVYPVSTHVDPVSTHVDPVSAQVDIVSTQVDPERTQVDPDSTQVDPVFTQVDPVSTQVDSVTTQVDPDSAQVDIVSTQVDPVSTEVDSVTTEVDPDSTQVDPVSTQVDPVSVQVDLVSTQVDPVSTHVDTVSAMVDPLDGQVNFVCSPLDLDGARVDSVVSQDDLNTQHVGTEVANKIKDCMAPPLEELRRGLGAENIVDDDRIKPCASRSGAGGEDPNVEEKLGTNIHQGLFSNVDAICLSENRLVGQEEGTEAGNAPMNDRSKQKSKRQCKKERKAKKKEGKLKNNSKVVQKADTAHLKNDVKGKCPDRVTIVKETDENHCSERKDVERKEEEKDKEEEEEVNWEANFDEDGECLNSEMLAELSEVVDVNSVEIQKPKFDYLSFKPKDIVLDSGVFDHVVELYDFSPELKTHDLVHSLSRFRLQGFDVHWVNDTHALAVFSNHKTAQLAIDECSNPLLKLRPLYEGTHESKLMAKRTVDSLQPYKERPKTTNIVANRLVSGALGVRSKMSKEERQLERDKIKAEREKKLTKAKQKKDLWESEDLAS